MTDLLVNLNLQIPAFTLITLIKKIMF